MKNCREPGCRGIAYGHSAYCPPHDPKLRVRCRDCGNTSRMNPCFSCRCDLRNQIAKEYAFPEGTPLKRLPIEAVQEYRSYVG